MFRSFSRCDFLTRFRSQDYGDWMMGRGLLMILGFLLVTAIVVTLVILLVRLSGQSSQNKAGTGSSGQSHIHQSMLDSNDEEVRQSLSILNERYARGEIDDDEYLRRKRHLTSGPK